MKATLVGFVVLAGCEASLRADSLICDGGESATYCYEATSTGAGTSGAASSSASASSGSGATGSMTTSASSGASSSSGVSATSGGMSATATTSSSASATASGVTSGTSASTSATASSTGNGTSSSSGGSTTGAPYAGPFFVQQGEQANWNGGSPSSLTATLTQPVASGDLLIVATCQGSGAAPLLEDTLGNTFHQVLSDGVGGSTIYGTLTVFYTISGDGGAESITEKYSAQGIPDIGIYVAEYESDSGTTLVGFKKGAAYDSDAGQVPFVDSITADGGGGRWAWAFTWNEWVNADVVPGPGYTARGTEDGGVWFNDSQGFGDGLPGYPEDSPIDGGPIQTASWISYSPSDFFTAILIFK